MRCYTPNSPEAAARVVAMALLADGHLSMTEVQAIDRLRVTRRLGLAPERFAHVLEGLCQDLLVAQGGPWTGSTALEPAIRRKLMGEITRPSLQANILALCQDVVDADGHLAEGESELLASLRQAWPNHLPGSGKAPPVLLATVAV